MVIRNWIIVSSLVGLTLTVGCGGITNANVKEKVITQKDLDDMRVQQQKLTEQGVKGFVLPANGGKAKAPNSIPRPTGS